MAQAQSDWMENISEYQFSGLATDSQLNAGLYSDSVILTHDGALI